MGGLMGKAPKVPKVVVPKVEAPPPPPAPAPVADMPVPDDIKVETEAKKRAAKRIAASGRASTVLTGDSLGGR